MTVTNWVPVVKAAIAIVLVAAVAYSARRAYKKATRPVPVTIEISKFMPGTFGVLERIELGGGIISPQALLPPRDGSKTITVATGRGELFGTSSLYEIDTDAARIVTGPVPVCRNIMSMERAGTLIFAACRGSSEVAVIDATTLALVERIAMTGQPVSVATAGETVFWVATLSGEIFRFERSEESRWQLTAQHNSTGQLHAILAAGEAIYATAPKTHQILKLDAKTLAHVRTHTVAGSPSFKLAKASGRVVATNRDGYLHVIDPSNESVDSIDLFELTGLDRTKSPVRLLDATDIAEAGDGSLVIVMNRIDSLVLSKDFKLIGRLAAGARAVANPAGGFVMSSPAASLLFTVRPGQKAKDLFRGREVTKLTIGSAPNERAIMLGNQVVILPVNPAAKPSGVRGVGFAFGNSDHQLHVIGQGGVYQRCSADLSCSKLGEIAEIPSPFSLDPVGDDLVAIGRLTDNTAVIRPDGSAQIVKPTLARPRRAVSIDAASRKWAMIHDTHPAVGLTVWQGTKEIRALSNRDLGVGSWFSDVAPCGAGRIALTTFAGEWLLLDGQQKILARGRTGVRGVSGIGCLADRKLLLVSEEEETVLVITPGQPDRGRLYSVPGLVAAIPGEGRTLHVATREAYLKISLDQLAP